MVPRNLRVALPIVLSLLCRAGYGQTLVPGYVVTTELDSIRGAICRHDEMQQQGGVDFVPMHGTHLRWLDVHQVKAYGYVHRRDTVRYVAVVLNPGTTHGEARCLFMRQLVAGSVELYDYQYSPPEPRGNFTPNEGAEFFPALSIRSARFGSGRALVMYYSAHNSTTEITWWRFPVDAATYFADCPALATDLRAKRYRSRDIAQVIKRYNAWCTAAELVNSYRKIPPPKTVGLGTVQTHGDPDSPTAGCSGRP